MKNLFYPAVFHPEKVGYSDPNYFSYVFKKQFGMSPSKYKAGKLGEK